MNYFNYQYSESLGEIWELFSELAVLSSEESLVRSTRGKFSHTEEIINSAMNKKLDNRECFTPETFNLRAYEAECSKNEEKKTDKSRERYLAIIDTTNGNEENTVGYGEISSNDSRLKAVDDEFEMFENNDEFERCLADLFNIRKDYIVVRGIDPVEMVSNALRGIPEAVSLVVDMVRSDDRFKNIIEVLCNGSIGRGEDSSSLLLRLEACI